MCGLSIAFRVVKKKLQLFFQFSSADTGFTWQALNVLSTGFRYHFQTQGRN